MEIKEDLKYTKDHEWIKIDGDVATVGITGDFGFGGHCFPKDLSRWIVVS